MRNIKKGLMLVVLLAAMMVTASGCDANLETLANAFFTGPLSDLFNLEQIGQVDLAGQRNYFIRDYPDWDDDPTCIIPGMCGPSLWYPFSTAPDTGEEPVTGFGD